MHFPEAAWKEWKPACYKELESLDKHDVFELTNLPNGCKTIGWRWVFNVKGDSCKQARLVTSQVERVDHNELFSPVVQFKSVHLMLTLAALHNWYMMGVDVCTAYLYGKLDEEIYMCQPKGFIARGKESKVIHLKRALYSIKQAGLAWWKELSNPMEDLGFTCLNSDAGIFMCQDSTSLTMAVVYVYDTMFFSKNKKLVKKKKALFMAKWECQDLRYVKEFLHMCITWTRSGITIDQCDYLEKVLEQFQLTNTKAALTSLLTNWEPKANTGNATNSSWDYSLPIYNWKHTVPND